MDDIRPSLAGLTEGERKDLYARWVEIGLMEHASVAAFARSVMQLMSVAAPEHLISATIAAMADETKHARWAFSLASAYAGYSVGPGPLPIDGALGNTDILDLITTTIQEGCIGETVAALEALEDQETTSDPFVREVLARICEDETRHAILAWRTLQWAFCEYAHLKSEICVLFAKTITECLASNTNALRYHVINQIVEPCFRALLAETGVSTSDFHAGA